MASGSDLAAKRVGPTWEVGPTEDVVRALMETLVDPLLPLGDSTVPPSEDAQESVAKQMHAVVLLYNYLHRKQKPELVFLDFVYFCKLAMVIRPPLIAFMKLMREDKPSELNGAQDQFSVTEKAIQDACDIAIALDASRDVPNTEGWPISKVAVLLIDSKKENCMLKFGAVTKGAWSPIEKELEESSTSPEISAEEKVGDKRKRNDQKALNCDSEFLQLGYDAVKDITGINSSELEVLETHVTYSLSKQKSAARFLMMQCHGSFNVNEQVPLKFLVESLQGPLAEKLDYGIWKTTPAIEFHHMLPYVEFISCWLSGIDLCLPNSSNCNAQSVIDGCSEELTKMRKSAFIASRSTGNDLDQIDNNSHEMEANSSDKIASENCDSNKNRQYSSHGKMSSPFNISQSIEKDGSITYASVTCDILDCAEKGRNSILENLANDSKQHDEGLISGLSRDLSQTVLKADNAMEEFKKGCDIADPAMKEASRISVEISDTNSDDPKGITMASGADLAAKEMGPTGELGPTEDVVQALMETLVDPLLPLRVSTVPPSADAQESVAKQMHAVVFLYNYHHRKQKPELVFLDFASFCQLAMVIRPPLTAFMKLMRENKPPELIGAQDQLSVTEKAIKDACDIAITLDASREVPNTEGWSISKVVVLLIDSNKENCMLKFGAVTKGAWSPIEKELEESSTSPEISAEEKVGDKRKRNDQKALTCDSEFLQLGYDAVKDITGIDSSGLEVLETHVTYSISKQKSAARFYMMQCSGSFNVSEQVPLKFLVESLRGPLAEKLDYGIWKTTPVVDFHHILPYVEFISRWLSGINSSLPNSSNCNAQRVLDGCTEDLTQVRTSAFIVSKNNGNDLDQNDNGSSGMEANSSDKIASRNCDINNKCEHSPHGKVSSPINIFQNTQKVGNVTDRFEKNCDILDSAEEGRDRILENLTYDSKQVDKGLPSGPSRGLSQTVVKADNAMDEFEKGCDIADPAINESSRISVEISDTDGDDQKGFISSPSRRLSGKTVIDDNVTEKSNEKHDITHFAKEEETRIYAEILDKDSDRCEKNMLSCPSKVLTTTNMSDLNNISTKSEDTSKKLNSKIRVYHHRRKTSSSTQSDAQLQEDGSKKVDAVDSLKSDCTQRGDEKVSGDKADVTNTSNQNNIAATGNQLAQFEAEIKHKEAQNGSVPEQLENALALLYRKRQELYSQICNMEDALTLYEDNIARIRDGGEVDLAHQCIKSVISGNYHSLLEHGTRVEDKCNQQGQNNSKSQHEKDTRLSEAYLPGKSPCQDLEYTCLKNNWRLPRYLTESSDGKFLANVVIEGKDFRFHAKGGFESKPCQARDSAAAQMIAVIRDTAYDQANLSRSSFV